MRCAASAKRAGRWASPPRFRLRCGGLRCLAEVGVAPVVNLVVANLHVAGSSVFPTSGRANPTYTLVALALRLADHLANGAKT